MLSDADSRVTLSPCSIPENRCSRPPINGPGHITDHHQPEPRFAPPSSVTPVQYAPDDVIGVVDVQAPTAQSGGRCQPGTYASDPPLEQWLPQSGALAQLGGDDAGLQAKIWPAWPEAATGERAEETRQFPVFPYVRTLGRCPLSRPSSGSAHRHWFESQPANSKKTARPSTPPSRKS